MREFSIVQSFWCAQTCSFRAVFGLPVRNLTLVVSATLRRAAKVLYRCTSTYSALNYCVRIFFSNPSALYTKWCAQTFPPIFGLFAIFDRDFAKIVAPPSNECENCVACLKEQSLPKKTLQTTPKSAYKWQRNACSNYGPLERTALRTRSVTKQKQKNKHSCGAIYRRTAICLVSYKAHLVL